VEKVFEGGREKLASLNIPVESLAAIVSMEGDTISFQ
jgi:hypothetical protein